MISVRGPTLHFLSTVFMGWFESEGMPEDERRGDISNEIVEELCDAARWFAGGGLTPEDYRMCVVTFEKRKMARFGVEILSEIAADGTVWVSLCAVNGGACLATVKLNPRTGEALIQ
jgi:hypothetical protein